MPRHASIPSIDKVIREAMEPIVERAAQAVARTIAELAAAELERRLVKRAGRKVAVVRSGPGRRRRQGEIRRWVADRRARRVPTFVIEATGLDTKKKIVARFGEDAAFEKGKPLPAARAVKARPPIIRKAAEVR